MSDIHTGYDSGDDEDYPSSPLDVVAGERRLVTQPYDFSVGQLLSDVNRKRILLMEVQYQREYVWDDAKASRLIESLLLNVPIPVCYYAEIEDGNWEVIDGLQRAQSIVRFLRGELRLRGLSVLAELNGKTFQELPGRDQRRIETRTMRFVVITNESHPDIKFDVFERLNTGAVKLTAQELRNCMYRGSLNDELRELADYVPFRTALGRPVKDSRMRDEELVLRFLSLVSDLAGYKPPLIQFLNEFMRANQREVPDAGIVNVFHKTMSDVAEVLADNAFRAFRDGKPSGNLNRALFDAVTLSFAFADSDDLRGNAGTVRERHAELLGEEAFLPMIGRATADRTRMHGRVSSYTDMLRSCGVRVALPTLPDE